jgi:hypothetical protein
MPWYHVIPLLGSNVALLIMIFTRPASVARPMAFTLLIGGLMLVTVGLVVKDLITTIYLAAWLSSN